MNTTGNKFGGRTKGTPNKLTSKIKDKLNRGEYFSEKITMSPS